MPELLVPALRSDVEISDRAFSTLASLLRREAGIVLEPSKRMLVQSRLGGRLRARGLNSLDDYIHLVRVDAEEGRRMISLLTTNHTRFFREPHHLRLLATRRAVYRDRIEAGDAVAIWSAGCSTGEEPYSMAMAVAGADRGDASPFLSAGFRILGTDLADHALTAARTASYASEALKDIPHSLRHWTRGAGSEFEIDPDLAGRVKINRLNLIGEWPMNRRFAAIFCRNVMIYFDEETNQRLVARLVAMLEPGGLLCLGHSERACGPAADLLRPIGASAFVRGDE